MYIVGIAKDLTHNEFWPFIFFFALFYTLAFVADIIKLIFSMSNVNIIVDIKLQANNSLHS